MLYACAGGKATQGDRGAVDVAEVRGELDVARADAAIDLGRPDAAPDILADQRQTDLTQVSDGSVSDAKPGEIVSDLLHDWTFETEEAVPDATADAPDQGEPIGPKPDSCIGDFLDCLGLFDGGVDYVGCTIEGPNLLYDPGSFNPYCDGSNIVDCVDGFVHVTDCAYPSQTYTCGVNGDGQAVCKLPGAAPCDADSFVEHCEGEKVIKCNKGFINDTLDCSKSPDPMVCTVDEWGAHCALVD